MARPLVVLPAVWEPVVGDGSCCIVLEVEEVVLAGWEVLGWVALSILSPFAATRAYKPPGH